MELCDFLKAAFDRMFNRFGEQHWWPGDTELEIAVGAILTQNTNWKNVERAITNLKEQNLLSLNALKQLSHKELAELIKPAGYFNIKAKRLKNFIDWLHGRGGFDAIRGIPTDRLRRELLEINGIGPETADSILLYSLNRPIFVVDAYTRRILHRHGMKNALKMGYDELRTGIEECLPTDAVLFNEFHALLVRAGKEFCRRNSPMCEHCPLNGLKISGNTEGEI